MRNGTVRPATMQDHAAGESDPIASSVAQIAARFDAESETVRAAEMSNDTAAFLDCICEASAAVSTALWDRIRLYGRQHAARILEHHRVAMTAAIADAVMTSLPHKPELNTRLGDWARCDECGAPFDVERCEREPRRCRNNVDIGYVCPHCFAWQTDPKECVVCECGAIIEGGQDAWRHHAGLCGGTS